MNECTSRQCLEYVGATCQTPESEEVLQFHAGLLAFQVSALEQLQDYHLSVPWKLVLALDATAWKGLLEGMRDTWSFVLNVVDLMTPTDPLYYELAITRFQCFRDAHTCAE